MKLLFENWRRFLTEVTFAQAENNLNDKTLYKALKAARWDYNNSELLRKSYIAGAPDALEVGVETPAIRAAKETTLKFIPNDIEDNQKGSALLWFIRTILKKPSGDYERHLRLGLFDGMWGSGINPEEPEEPLGMDYMQNFISGLLETFFQHNRFMSERDINNIRSIVDLHDMVKAAKPKIQAYLDKQSYLDAEQGKQTIYEDDNWQIVIPTNKGAACELGKGTDWCTAAPGLDYYEEYHKPNDPLFIFVNKRDPEDRYQFHFGTGQFMDQNDQDATHLLKFKLWSLLKKADYEFPKHIKDTIEKTDYKLLDNGAEYIKYAGGGERWDWGWGIYRRRALRRDRGGSWTDYWHFYGNMYTNEEDWKEAMRDAIADGAFNPRGQRRDAVMAALGEE